jgi:hypothetical protein
MQVFDLGHRFNSLRPLKRQLDFTCGGLLSLLHEGSPREALRGLIDEITLEPDGEPAHHPEGKPGGYAATGPAKQKAVGDRRPLGPNNVGCGGVQPAVLAALDRGRMTPVVLPI